MSSHVQERSRPLSSMCSTDLDSSSCFLRKTATSCLLPIVCDVLSHLPLPQRSGESIRDHVARYTSIQAKEKECQQMEARLNKEKQFNRKVEINAALRCLRAELDSLHPA